MIYEVRVTIANHRAEEWLQWIPQHVNDILATSCFVSATIEESQLPLESRRTFVVRYTSNTLADYQRYLDTYASHFREEGRRLFDQDMTASRDVLRQLECIGNV